MNRLVTQIVLAVVLVLGSTLAVQPSAMAEKPPIFAPGGVAIRGFDPVGYFAEGKPIKGSAEFALRWRGATWHFASAANRDLFKASPEKYAPQYGGYCAFGVAQGHIPESDPDLWRIVDGKLYLNLNSKAQELWNRDIPGQIRSADQNWPAVLGK